MPSKDAFSPRQGLDDQKNHMTELQCGLNPEERSLGNNSCTRLMQFRIRHDAILPKLSEAC